ncbi:MAG: aquaporin Z [Snowella sp.]|nr:aquaporin Z [Snowella sp.]
MKKEYIAEFLGTFWLVLGGCGSAVFAATFSGSIGEEGTRTIVNLGIGLVGVSLAFGLTVLTGAYAFGHISGGHFNPAVSIGLVAGKRFHSKNLVPYIVAQVIGAIVAALVIVIIANGKSGFDPSGSNPLATNGFGPHSPGGYNLLAAAITEIVLTFVFLIIILGATDKRAPAGFAPVPIGLGLTLIHLISIPITNTSVNPARSTGVAIFCGNFELIAQLPLFWIAPILGAIAAGYVYSNFLEQSPYEPGPETDLSE